MGEKDSEFRRTLAVTWLAVRGVLGFIPFLGNLLASLFLGGTFRRKVRELMESAESVPVDEGSVSPSTTGVSSTTTGKIYFLAGEDSGDLHAANLAAEIRARAPEVELRGMGGSLLEQAGCRLDHDLVRMNVMGFLPVLRSAGTFFGLFRNFLRMLDTDPPDVLVPVDYPGFNLRAARAARKRGVKVVYYIAPQIWAWAPWRIRKIARCVDRMLVILPFEKELYAGGGVACAFVGHPLYEHLEDVAPVREVEEDGLTPRVIEAVESSPRVIGLLPGSRRGEVRGVLPMMLRAARRVRDAHGEVEFVLPYRGPALESEIHRILAREGKGLDVRLAEGRTHEEMARMDLALVASGTASLELAYYRVPMVVLYRVGRLASLLKRFFLITPHVALVNIVAGRRIMPEFVRAGDSSAAAAERLLDWIEDEGRRRDSREALETVRSRLLFQRVSARAAEWILREL